MKKLLLLFLIFGFTQICWASNSDHLVIATTKFSKTTHSDGNFTRHISVHFATLNNENTSIFVRFFQSSKVLSRKNFRKNLPDGWLDQWGLPVKPESGGVYFQNLKPNTKSVIINFRDERVSGPGSGKWHLVKVSENSTRCPSNKRFREVVGPDGAETFKHSRSTLSKGSDGNPLYRLYIRNQMDHADSLIAEIRTNGLNGESICVRKNKLIRLTPKSEEGRFGQKVISMTLPKIPDQERLVVIVKSRSQTNKWRRFIYCYPDDIR
jgi:hypothetical protein